MEKAQKLTFQHIISIPITRVSNNMAGYYECSAQEDSCAGSAYFPLL